jgi:hypothetical protein
LSHLYIKCIILQGQARDKHRENSKSAVFSQVHSVHGDPGFARVNPPWATDWRDFTVSDAAAKRVGHNHIDTSSIGLSDRFGFDRTLIGRRLMFREGDPAAGAKNGIFSEFSLCLSQACLGKMIIFIYKWRKNAGFRRRTG